MSNKSILFRGSLIQPLRKLVTGRTHTDVSTYRQTSAESGSRLYALDLARFVAMILMMQGHILDALVTPTVIDVNAFPWNIWHMIRGITAPVFLMVSGAVHVFANKRDSTGRIRPDALAKRIRWGLTLIGIGYLMVFPANRVWDLPYVPSSNWQTALAVNILQLTGATILLFAAVMSSTRNVASMGFRALVTGLSILAITPIMHSSYINSSVLPAWIVPYLNASTGSLFPFFPFASYLFFGVAVGAYLHAVPADQRMIQLQKYGWRVGGILAGLALFAHLVAWKMGLAFSEISHSGSVSLVLLRIGFVLMMFSASAWALNKTWRFRTWYSMFSTRSLFIYVIHLVILFGTPWFDGIGRTHFRQYGLAEGLLMMFAIMASTLFITWAIDFGIKRKWSMPARHLFSAGALLVAAYLLLV
ncbi:MAG: acyltransferase [bacterium]|nr:acyltransferase [bacterium]